MYPLLIEQKDIISQLTSIEEKLQHVIKSNVSQPNHSRRNRHEQRATTSRYDNDTRNRQQQRNPFSNMRGSSLRDENDNYLRMLRTKRDSSNRNYQKKRVLENRMDDMEQRLNAFYGQRRQ